MSPPERVAAPWPESFWSPQQCQSPIILSEQRSRNPCKAVGQSGLWGDANSVCCYEITKMHLSQGRRLEGWRWKAQSRPEPLGDRPRQDPGSNSPQGAWKHSPNSDHQNSGLSLHSCWLVTLSPQIKGSCTGLGQPSWGDPCSAAGPTSAYSSQEQSGGHGLGKKSYLKCQYNPFLEGAWSIPRPHPGLWKECGRHLAPSAWVQKWE